MRRIMRKKTEKGFQKSETRNAERARFKKLVNGLKKTRNHLKKEIRQRNGNLKVKSGQIKQQKEKQLRSEAQIHIHTQAMESAADGIFIIDAAKPNSPVIYANKAF